MQDTASIDKTIRLRKLTEVDFLLGSATALVQIGETTADGAFMVEQEQAIKVVEPEYTAVITAIASSGEDPLIPVWDVVKKRLGF